MTWKADAPQGNEAAKVKFDIVQYTRGRGLDLGCGPSKAYPHFIGVDSLADTGLFGIPMKPDVTSDCLDLPFKSASMEFVFSSHLLEHVADTGAALAEWWRVIKSGGHLVLYLPHRDLYPNVGQPGANPDHKHDFVEKDIAQAMAAVAAACGVGWDLLVSEKRDAGNEYSFLQVYRKRTDAECVNTFRNSRPPKTACVVRYGGFGDQIQAANILPELKRQGYHVTFMTTPRGQEILRHDPHIDAWFIQDNDQVPNGELGPFWKAQARRFDKFINLSESVEGTLLAMPGRIAFNWPDAMRRKALGRNYLEFTADIAGLPYRSEAKFYPSGEEREWALDFVAQGRAHAFDPTFNVLWALSGSSVHKFTPHQDTILMRMLVSMPEVRIVFTGDEACQILECGWEKEARIRRMSAKLSIRQTLALAQQVDLVVGPETGVLNAVAFEDNAKLVFLSHSSAENLTKHWVNTTAIEPKNTPCYPCHKLHYGRGDCPIHEPTGSAICQWNTDPDEAYLAALKVYEGWKRVQQFRRTVAA